MKEVTKWVSTDATEHTGKRRKENDDRTGGGEGGRLLASPFEFPEKGNQPS